MANQADQVRLIDAFVEEYYETWYMYDRAAAIARSQCIKALDSQGIRQITTYRAKSPERLREKLLQRLQRRPGGYPDRKSIKTDIVDLAGVRIAVYFPDDRHKVQNLIRRLFHVNDEIRFPREEDSAVIHEYQREFQGYRADHYRVQLRREQLSEVSEIPHGPCSGAPPVDALIHVPIEVQVASVLMHAWSEVNHDLGYKAIDGEPSQNELQILDGINGLVNVSELFLRQLQNAGELRVSYLKQTFTNHYELGAFLQKNLAEIGAFAVGPMDILFIVIQSVALDSPKALRPFVQSWMKKSAQPGEAADVLGFLNHIFTGHMPTGETEVSNWRRIQNMVRDAKLTGDYGRRRAILLEAVKVHDALAQRAGRPKLWQFNGSSPSPDRAYWLYWSVINSKDYPEAGVANMDQAVDELWKWFEGSSDMKKRLSLAIASVQQSSVGDEIMRSRRLSIF
ncbi:hypothetical protein ASPWEDRAFT_64736 [Aspergillus wentii DTO 134E9]|uniref:RelA/SpoT domain-containing protein n=1 Tax=Aspergillus wentii DTO 134E9 TaxID=1073089 RepID=A0A1L9S2V9_ASPWE|nr:uncharacterized protein ASPWEDRAFT_64736 [Aspergillus wentii DTO 134E9]KAI9929844.1 hypothetical protein MW887_011650 [Aspergillus wentii]OJJ41494.1 hypothetical protein ASPWEDRAFT_64736 [Aspergillus wentii DTO 134E9]